MGMNHFIFIAAILNKCLNFSFHFSSIHGLISIMEPNDLLLLTVKISLLSSVWQHSFLLWCPILAFDSLTLPPYTFLSDVLCYKFPLPPSLPPSYLLRTLIISWSTWEFCPWMVFMWHDESGPLWLNCSCTPAQRGFLPGLRCGQTVSCGSWKLPCAELPSIAPVHPPHCHIQALLWGAAAHWLLAGKPRGSSCCLSPPPYSSSSLLFFFFFFCFCKKHSQITT